MDKHLTKNEDKTHTPPLTAPKTQIHQGKCLLIHAQKKPPINISVSANTKIAHLPFPSWSEPERAQADNGLLSAPLIGELIKRGAVSAQHIDTNQIQPASLDLKLGRRGFRLQASFLPGPNAQIAKKAEQLSLQQFELAPDQDMVLETGCVYLVELAERLALPENISALASPKSSTGRIDVFTRLITDFGSYFDQVPQGYKGPLYLEIAPRSFGIIVRAGSKLAQLRFRQGRIAYDNYRLSALHKQNALIAQDEELKLNQGLLLSVDLSGEPHQLCGYRAKRHTPLIDVDQSNAYEIKNFWEPIYAPHDKRIILDPDAFYILASREAVRIPPTHAAEMMPFDSQIGEFRAHYAGFFDPGFGMEANASEGASAVLEIRSREIPFILEHGQTIGRLVFERLLAASEQHYDKRDNAHYQGQGLALSKHFKK